MKPKKAVVNLQLIAVFITVVVLGVIFLPWLAQIQSLGSDLRFEKKLLAIDFAQSLHALPAARNNAYLLYTGLGKFNLSYSLGPSIIEVFEGKDKAKDGSLGFSYFAEDGPGGVFLHHKDLVSTNKTIASVFISKQGREIFFDSPNINPKFRVNLNYLSCPKKIIPFSKTIIDPGHGWDEAGQKGDRGNINLNENITESKISMQLANALSGLLSRITAVDKTRDFAVDSPASMAQRVSSAGTADSIISIHVGSSSDLGANNAIAYFNVHSQKKEESIRLGCSILNALSDAFPQITGLAYVPVNLDNELKSNPESPYSILLEDKVAVLLELGNIQMQKPNPFLEQAGQIEIAKAVLAGVERYHGIK